jgi:hypothetical protein
LRWRLRSPKICSRRCRSVAFRRMQTVWAIAPESHLSYPV